MLGWLLDQAFEIVAFVRDRHRRRDETRMAEEAYRRAIEEATDALVDRGTRHADHPRPRLRTLDHPTDA